MNRRSRLPALSLLACSLAVLTTLPVAEAQSRRERQLQNMLQTVATAEATVRAKDSSPEAVNAALQTMQDAVLECARLKGCDQAPLLATFRGAVAAQAAATVPGDSEDMIDFTADDVPREAQGDALLDESNRRFAQAVQFNPAVQSGIRRWLTDLRPSLMQSFTNYEYMRPLMAPAFKRHHLPEALLFGILAKESNGKVHVGSRAGAVGPLQFMPATGRRFGLGNDGSGFDTRYDPQQAAEAAAAYLEERNNALAGNIEMALAAYNGGEGRAQRIYNAGGTNFWDYNVYNQFPAETRDYVPMVIAAAWLFLHPEEYGVQFPRVAAKPSAIRLKQPTSLYELTICLGNTRDSEGFQRALRNLNPRLTLEAQLPAGGVINATTQIARLYNRHCASGERAALARQLVTSDPSLAVVRVGGMTSVQSVDASGNPGPQARVVNVPGQGPVQTTVATGKPAPVTRTSPKPAKPRQYTVARGDTLVSIAQKFECDTKSLAKNNGIKAPRYAIQPGQKLKLEGCR